MIKIAIISPDTVPLKLLATAPATMEWHGKVYQSKDKWCRTTATGKRAWKFAETLSKNSSFDVTLYIPDLNYPGKQYIDTTNVNFKMDSYNYESARWDWSEDLDKKLLQYNYVIIQTTDGVGFKNCSVLPGNIHVIVDGWVPVLAELPVAYLSYHRIQRKFYWERFYNFYKDLIIRSNCVLYANERQKYYYEGQFFSFGKLGWKAFKFSPLLNIPYGIDIREKIQKKIVSTKLNLLWFCPVYPWYNAEDLVKSIAGDDSINLDFVAIKHPRFNRLYKTFYKEYSKNIDRYSNINIHEEYVENLGELFSQYDAGIILAQDWLEEQFAHRARIFDMLSYGFPVITNKNNPSVTDLSYLNIIKGIDTSNILEDLKTIHTNKASLVCTDEGLLEFQNKRSWDSVLEPLNNYINTFSQTPVE
jgi:hypothetical protein